MAIGRDPNYWDDAEVFRLERFANSTVDFKGMDMEFIPFGAGRRMCPGLAFAEAIMDLLFSTLLFHFDWFGGRTTFTSAPSSVCRKLKLLLHFYFVRELKLLLYFCFERELKLLFILREYFCLFCFERERERARAQTSFALLF